MSKDSPHSHLTAMARPEHVLMTIKAGHLEPSALPVLPPASLCQAFIDGFCRRGHSCRKSHEICAVDDNEPVPPNLEIQPNHLSFEPRHLPPHNSPFDDDGPGHLSGLGPRHDNDHVSIKDIRILPTTDEILSKRPSFMPRKSSQARHHLPLGQERHLDTLFRQLRHESIEPIIDACYHASQQLAVLAKQTAIVDYDDRMVTPRKGRYSLFHDIAFEDTMFNPSRGLQVRVSFACPRALRGRLMGLSKRFEEGMLVALIGLSDDGCLSTTFMDINQRQTTESMKRRTGNDLRGRSIIATHT